MSSIDLYNEVSVECSKKLTNRYSTSFSSGIRLFDRNIRNHIYSIYGFVRVADEIVDTFHDYDKEELFKNFRKSVEFDFEKGISANPIINSYIKVCNLFNIPYEYTDAFLDSMEMDLYHTQFTKTLYNKYIYGSAEVIGLMCLKVFCQGDEMRFNELKNTAQKLGSAFQKINFLRDLDSDQCERGRIYFPNLPDTKSLANVKIQIEKEIEEEFNLAYDGVLALPDNSRLGVYVAYKYYSSLLKKIQKSDANKVQNSRIRISDFRKFFILTTSLAKHQLNFV